MTKTLACIVVLAACLAACGESNSLKVEGLDALLSPAERAALEPHLDGDTLDLSASVREYKGAGPGIIHTWAAQHGPLTVRAWMSTQKAEVAIEGERLRCTAEAPQAEVEGRRRLRASGVLDCDGTPRAFELLLDPEVIDEETDPSFYSEWTSRE